LWQAACAPADLLDEHFGARAEYSAISNRSVEKGYGRWLTFLHSTDPTCLTDLPPNRITPERVQAYVGCLAGLKNGTATILSRLKELLAAAKVMGPSQDWAFLNRLSSKVRARHRPVRNKSNLKLSDELLDLGLLLLTRRPRLKDWLLLSVSNSTCGRLGISSAATTQSTIAGPAALSASLIWAWSSPGLVARKPWPPQARASAVKSGLGNSMPSR
jgi:hypothetical protein